MVAASADQLPVTLVVPVFNEEQRLARNADEFVRWIERQPDGSALLVTDDGSSDGTKAVMDHLSACSSRVVLLQSPHRGKGAAVQAGLLRAETPLAGFTDVDLSTPLTEIDRLFGIAAFSPSLVIGSRGAETATIRVHQTGAREWLGRLFNAWAQLLVAPGVSDTQCGAKTAQTWLWRDILEHAREPGFAWDTEVVAIALRLGAHVEEIGVEWSHDPTSRVHVLRDGIAMALTVLRIAARSQSVVSGRRESLEPERSA